MLQVKARRYGETQQGQVRALPACLPARPPARPPACQDWQAAISLLLQLLRVERRHNLHAFPPQLRSAAASHPPRPMCMLRGGSQLRCAVL